MTACMVGVVLSAIGAELTTATGNNRPNATGRILRKRPFVRLDVCRPCLIMRQSEIWMICNVEALSHQIRFCEGCRKRCRRLSRSCIKGNKKPAEAGCVTPGELLNPHANCIGYCIATCHSGKVNGRLLNRPRACRAGDNSYRTGGGVAIIHLYIELFGKLAQ